MTIARMNDKERRMWVENDEILYDQWKWSELSLYTWVKENRKMIDKHINVILNQNPIM